MKTLTIYETSDIHGYLYPTMYQSKTENKPFGLCKIAKLYKDECEQLNGPSILIDNGDILQGSPLSYFVLKSDQHPKALVEAYNQLPYDVGVIGNHEFNYGLSYLKQAINETHYPIISANILNDAQQPALGEPYVIIEKEGIRCAVLGLTTQYIPHWEHPSHYEGLHFESAVKMAKHYIPTLHQLADVVVVSYHGGFEKDINTREEIEAQTGENEGIRLLEEVDGIDVLLTGHQHNVYAQVVNGVAVVMPGHKGSHLGKVTLHFSEIDGGYHLEDAIPEVIPVDTSTDVDLNMSQQHARLNQSVNEWLDQPIGRVTGGATIFDPHEARLSSHPYVALINQIQMDVTGTSISGTSLFNNEVKGLPEVVTIRDIVTNYIYPNTLAVLSVTGAELKAALEQTATYYTLDHSSQIAINPDWMDPKPKPYNYDMYAGIEYTLDIAKPVGQRVVSLTYRGQPIQLDETYEVVMNLYRAVGGGDYHMFDASKIIKEITIPMTELIADYIERNTPVQIERQHFKVINSNHSV